MQYNHAMMNTSATPEAASTKPNSIVVFGGGTIMHVRNHMALCAPAYGSTAKKFSAMIQTANRLLNLNYNVDLRLTKMADCNSCLETNDDVEASLLQALSDPLTAGVVCNVALCDFIGQIGDVPSGKYATRLQTREVTEEGLGLVLRPTKKLLGLVHELRPDVVSVGFKTTADETPEQQVAKSNRMANESRISWMLANDTVTRNNVVLRGCPRTPTGFVPRTLADADYSGTVREDALRILAMQFLTSIKRG